MTDTNISLTFNPEEWDGYVESHPDGGVYLSSRWKTAVEKGYEHQTFYLSARKNNVTKGVLPLVFIKVPLLKGTLVSLPFCDYGGLLADDEEVANLLLKKAVSISAELKAGLEIRCHNVSHLLESDSRFFQATKKCRMVLELPGNTETLWVGFKSKLRSQIKRAKKAELVFKLGDREYLADFYTVFSRHMRYLGSPVHSISWFREITTTFAENSKIGVVYIGHQPCAAGIALKNGNSVTIPWASSLREFNRLSPNMLLYWSFLEYAAENGFQYFDFGRSTPGEGTYHFKKQWGAQRFPLYWYQIGKSRNSSRFKTKESQADHSWYRKILEKVWASIPLTLANKVGPLIRKYISR